MKITQHKKVRTRAPAVIKRKYFFFFFHFFLHSVGFFIFSYPFLLGLFPRPLGNIPPTRGKRVTRIVSDNFCSSGIFVHLWKIIFSPRNQSSCYEGNWRRCDSTGIAYGDNVKHDVLHHTRVPVPVRVERCLSCAYTICVVVRSLARCEWSP